MTTVGEDTSPAPEDFESDDDDLLNVVDWKISDGYDPEDASYVMESDRNDGVKLQAIGLRSSNPRLLKPHVRIFYGPMYYGKSRALFKHVLNYALCGHQCLVFKFAIDSRYDEEGNENDLVSHDNHRLTPDTHPNITIRRISRNTFEDYIDGKYLDVAIEKCTVIAIDEGHFATGDHILVRLAEKWVDVMAKVLIVAGLSLWASGDEITIITELIVRAEKPKFKTGRCRTCNENNAIRSVLISDMKNGFSVKKDPETKPGGKEVYTSICRSCYNAARRAP